MRVSLLKAIVFIAVATATFGATGPLIGLLAAMTATSDVPVWAYAGAFSVLLLAATSLALMFDGAGLESLGLALSRSRVREFSIGFAVGAVLFAVLALVRGATVEAAWTFTGLSAVPTACAGLVTAFLLLFPEELLFRGYAFQRMVDAVGAWPGILISATLFGVYHLAGSGMWGMGAFFLMAMPTLAGVVFGWSAVRTKGLALPTGLHLGGNWIQASLLSFQPQSNAVPGTLWTADVTDVQQRFLYAPDLGAHVPFIATMLLATVAVRLVCRRQERTAS